MRIISKYKDYFDYLSGIYGEDPLIVLDRRKSDPKPVFTSNCKLRLYIGGHLVEAWFTGGQFYYGSALEQFDIPEDDYYRFRKHSRQLLQFGNATMQKLYGTTDVKVIDINDEYTLHHFHTVHVLTEQIIDTFDINEKENCPIVLKIDNDTYRYPKLDELDLPGFLSAETAYHWVSDWLSLQRTKAENHVDTRTNIEKIEGDGFDKVTSFRK